MSKGAILSSASLSFTQFATSDGCFSSGIKSSLFTTTIESFKNITGLTKEDFYDKEKNKFLVDFLSTFPTLIVSDKTIFAHAAYNPDLSPEEQEEYFLIWNRQNFWDRNFTRKAIYFGHTPSKKEDHTIVYYSNNCACIDLGTYKYQKMVGVEIKSKEEYYID